MGDIVAHRKKRAVNWRSAQFADHAGRHGYSALNFVAEKPTTYVYRIISQKRLFEVFDTKRNVLVAPALWDDPFENFILNSSWRLPSGETGTFAFKKDFFGQCWTLQAASDAMWRIYSPDKDGVRIRTTIGRLAAGMAMRLGEWGHVQCFIGRVQYLAKPAMLKFTRSVLTGGLDAATLASTLLVKRLAFTHEREVRLLYFEKEQLPDRNLFAYDFDPHEMIDQITTDPRASNEASNNLKQEIKRRTGFAGKIQRSLLYAPPEQLLIPVG